MSDWEKTYSLEDVDLLSDELIGRFSDKKIWLFEGGLGAGKTTLIQSLCKNLGVTGDVNSPTFSLVNEYKSDVNAIIYHLDLYRLKTLDQALEIGLFELVDSGYFCLIEWASAIGFKPVKPYILLNIEHLNIIDRHISVKIYEN